LLTYYSPSELVLALAPGDGLDNHTLIFAGNPPHIIDEENQETPKRNKLESPLSGVVVAWTFDAAL
jgi:hypothetical protein